MAEKQDLQPIVIRLERKTYDELKARAAEEERTMVQTVRRALRDYLGTHAS